MDTWFGHDRSIRGLRLITAPTVEPVTLAQAKTHLRLPAAFTADDAYVTALIIAARQWCETFTRRAFCTQSWRLTLDAFPSFDRAFDDLFLFFWRRGIIDIPKPPVVSIDSVSYVAVDGTTGTLVSGTDFRVDIQDSYCRLEPPFGATWPLTLIQMAATTINFTSGYTGVAGDTGNLIPGPIKQAILLLVGSLYENREDQGPTRVESIPKGIEFLLWPYKTITFVR